MFPYQQPLGTSSSYPAVYHNLMLVGLLGAIYRTVDDTAVVNAAVELTLADTTVYTMCRAIALGMGGNAEVAKECMDEHLERHPEDDAAKVTMAVSMMLSGDPQWKQWIDNVLATSTDQNARHAANGVRAYLRDIQRAH